VLFLAEKAEEVTPVDWRPFWAKVAKVAKMVKAAVDLQLEVPWQEWVVMLTALRHDYHMF
jgi:hypothetical protein